MTKSPVEVVGLRKMLRETDVPQEVLVDDNIFVLLQPQFVVPEIIPMDYMRKKSLKSLELNIVHTNVFSHILFAF